MNIGDSLFVETESSLIKTSISSYCGIIKMSL